MKNPVTVYLPDEQGNQTTYLTVSELSELLDISTTTVGRWIRAGSVRTRPAIRGTLYASLLDAALLRVMPVKKSRELGLRRYHPDELRRTRERYMETQGRTTPARNHRDEWDSYDVQYLIDEFTAGTRIEDIALELGRTYAAIVVRLELLRSEGELPAIDHGNPVLEQIMRLVLPAERKQLERMMK